VTATAGTARNVVAITGLALLAVLFASLALWQYRRAEESRATLAQFASAGIEDALPRELDDGRRFHRLSVDGAYVAEPQFLLDNMLHEGVAGYHVLTALRVPGRRERLLVNRGWVPVGRDRGVLPNVAVDGGERTVVGRLERLPRPGLRLGEQSAERSDSTVVLQYPTAAELAVRLGEPVLDYQLLLDADAADGFVRDWQAPGLAPERHLAYAGQWLALCLGAFGTAAVMALKSVRRKP
jgi:surfeit locus 1 family protein